MRGLKFKFIGDFPPFYEANSSLFGAPQYAPFSFFYRTSLSKPRTMTSNWEEFYSKNPKPESFNDYDKQIKQFVSRHSSNNEKIVLVTSGGTTVPLEHNTVRFVDNFSAGTRGSASTEFFLDYGYVVIFLYRLKSLEPFVRHFSGQTFLDMLEVNSNTDGGDSINIKQEKVPKLLPILKKYQSAVNSGRILSIPFTTLADYLWLLRACCDSLSTCKERAMLYLAAAVSDFYVPSEKLPVHKIQSTDGLPNISLQLVPKVLKPLVSSWVPNAFVISFKLETDENILLVKAKDALQKYNHHLVIGNILNTRKNRVDIVTKDGSYILSVSDADIKDGLEIEIKIVGDVAKRHDEFISSKSNS